MVFLAASFVMGHAMAPLSFPLGVSVSKRLERLIDRVHGKHALVQDEKRETELGGQVRLVLDQRYPGDPYLRQIDDAALPSFCKKVLLEGTTRFAQQLDEIEAEINLRTGFSAPMLVFGALWTCRSWPDLAGLLPSRI